MACSMLPLLPLGSFVKTHQVSQVIRNTPTEWLDWFGRDGQKWSVGTYVGIGTTNNYLKVSDMYCSYSVDQMRATKIDADKNI